LEEKNLKKVSFEQFFIWRNLYPAGDLKPGDLKAELRAYLDHAGTILPWADPKFWPRLRYSLPPPPPSPDLTAMSQSTTLHSLQSYPSSTHYQDPELVYGGPRYHHHHHPSSQRTALLYSPLTIDPVAGGTCRNSGGTLYTLQSVRGGGGGGGQTYYATSTTNSRGTAISHIYQVVE
jgi:hypothetical protein